MTNHLQILSKLFTSKSEVIIFCCDADIKGFLEDSNVIVSEIKGLKSVTSFGRDIYFADLQKFFEMTQRMEEPDILPKKPFDWPSEKDWKNHLNGYGMRSRDNLKTE